MQPYRPLPEAVRLRSVIDRKVFRQFMTIDCMHGNAKLIERGMRCNRSIEHDITNEFCTAPQMIPTENGSPDRKCNNNNNTKTVNDPQNGPQMIPDRK